MAFVPIGKQESMRFEPGHAVRVRDRWIAVFKEVGADGREELLAIDNACPHASAPPTQAQPHQAPQRVQTGAPRLSLVAWLRGHLLPGVGAGRGGGGAHQCSGKGWHCRAC